MGPGNVSRQVCTYIVAQSWRRTKSVTCDAYVVLEQTETEVIGKTNPTINTHNTKLKKLET